MVLLLLLSDQSWTTCYSASVLTLIDSIYIVSRFSSLVPLFFLVLGIWVIHFWRLGWDSGISSQLCLRIWGGFHSCEFFFCILFFLGLIIFFNYFSLFFFGGMSIHLSTAMLAHLFSYDMYVSFLPALPCFVQFTEVDICFLFFLIRTWGSTGKEVERSSFWIEGEILFIGISTSSLLTSGRPVFWSFIIISPSYLATLQAVLHHLLRSYRHDDHFHYRCRTFWVADSRMELGFDNSAFACCGMSYSFTRKSDCYFILFFNERADD